LIEFIRRNDDVLLGLTQAQVISIVMFVAGAVWIAVKTRRGQLWATSPVADRSVPETGA
jgi:prolipoprotein diacylglyceryltransferase